MCRDEWDCAVPPEAVCCELLQTFGGGLHASRTGMQPRLAFFPASCLLCCLLEDHTSFPGRKADVIDNLHLKPACGNASHQHDVVNTVRHVPMHADKCVILLCWSEHNYQNKGSLIHIHHCTLNLQHARAVSSPFRACTSSNQVTVNWFTFQSDYLQWCTPLNGRTVAYFS